MPVARIFRGERRAQGRPWLAVTWSDGTTGALEVYARPPAAGFDWGHDGEAAAELALALCMIASGSGEVATVSVRRVLVDLVAPMTLDSWDIPATRVLDTIARAREFAAYRNGSAPQHLP